MQRAGDNREAPDDCEEGQAESIPETETPPTPPNSLWRLMNRDATGSVSAELEHDGVTPTSTSEETETSCRATESRPDQEVSAEDAAGQSPEDSTPLRGLWKTIGESPSASTDPTEVRPVATEPIKTAADDPPRERFQEAHTAFLDVNPTSGVDVESFGFVTSQASPRRVIRAGCSRNAKLSLLLGTAALLLALLAGLPTIWSKIPSPLLGCAALTWGYVAWQDIQRSQGRQTGKSLALCGMVCGVIGVFVGPLVVAPWTQRLQRSQASQQRHTHLQQIGNGLNAYYTTHQVFPAGGSTQATDSGSPQPMHGWMTNLLPHLNQQAVHQSINLDLPYNHPSNLAPFQQQIDIFLVPGGNTNRVGQGYAVSHWSALGGSVLGPMGTVPIGVMSANSRVTRGDVTDGLSQTLVAGEISDRIPAWGSATNWRRIGKGLNREYHGFGSVTGQGAMFLHADGSVRHYNSQTSSDVLRRLSTRNAGD